VDGAQACGVGCVLAAKPWVGRGDGGGVALALAYSATGMWRVLRTHAAVSDVLLYKK